MIPKHIAIIMDGNRRWAKDHGLSVLAGHRRVADDVLEPLVEYAADCGVEYLTFWAFSTENWNRAKSEVNGIMRIFRHMINKKWQRLHEKGVRIKVIGDLSAFDKDIQESLEKVVEQTKNNKKITTVFALNYGGRDELLRAIRNIQINKYTNKQINEKEFEKYLDTTGIPDPDMIVRTSGEQRLSGFLPWQSVYSELYFPPWHMPDFTMEKFDEVLAEYEKRSRRFGR